MVCKVVIKDNTSPSNQSWRCTTRSSRKTQTPLLHRCTTMRWRSCVTSQPRARVTVCAVGRTMFSLTEYMAQRVDSPFNIVIPTNKGRGRSFSKFPSKIHAGKSNVACSRIIEYSLSFFFFIHGTTKIFIWLRKKDNTSLHSKTSYRKTLIFHIWYDNIFFYFLNLI